jgi:hypothetical protein
MGVAMSALGDLITSLTGDNTGALSEAADVIGSIASFAGGAGSFVSALINIVQPADQRVQQTLVAMQAKIDDDFRHLTKDIAAQGILDKERDIDLGGVNPAAAILAILPTIISELPTLPEDYVLAQIQTCIGCVQFFTDYDDKWVIPWDSLPQYSDKWSGTIAPPPSQFIFNYQYVLPQFLRAIYIFQAVVTGLRPSYLSHPDFQALLAKCAAKLQTVHDTMAAGITGTTLPTAGEVAEIGTSQGAMQWRSPWYGAAVQPIMSFWGSPDLWPFGAVEIYSGLASVQSYAVFEPFEFLPSPGYPPAAFAALVALRVANCKKQMYKQLGLPAIRAVINQLLMLTGQPVSTARGYETWSLREAASIMGIPVGGHAPAPFWATLRAQLSQFAPYDGWFLYPAEAQQRYPATPLPTSFLSLFSHA